MALHSDARFLPDLLQRLWDGPKEAAWAELVALLQELTGLARHLQPGNRTSLFTRLGQLGLFQVGATQPASLLAASWQQLCFALHAPVMSMHGMQELLAYCMTACFSNISWLPLN